MTTPIRDEDSASAVVPLIIRGPAELGDKIKQFKFERSFDPALAQRADRVLERREEPMHTLSRERRDAQHRRLAEEVEAPCDV